MNIHKLIGDSKNRDVIIKSFLWNTLIEYFKEKKWIHIEKYLVSLRISENTFFIKTNNPLINSEFLMVQNEIKTLFLPKLEKVWIIYENIEMKFI